MKSSIPLLAALVLTSTGAFAKSTTIILPGSAPGSEVILLTNDSVRKELKITSLQAAVLDSLRSDYRDEARAIVAKTGTDAESKAVSARKLAALQNSYDSRAMRTLSSEQRTRLDEIETQILGGFMLVDPKVQRKLDITQAQREEIAKVWAKSQKYVSDVNKWFEDGEISGSERLSYLREDRLDRSEDFLKILTSAQLEAFNKLRGEKFIG